MPSTTASTKIDPIARTVASVTNMRPHSQGQNVWRSAESRGFLPYAGLVFSGIGHAAGGVEELVLGRVELVLDDEGAFLDPPQPLSCLLYTSPSPRDS